MARKHHLAAKDLDPRQNQEKKTVNTRLVGGQQLSVTRPRGSKKKIQSSQPRNKELGEILSRLITRMTPGPKFPPAFDAARSYTMRRRWVSAENVSLSAGVFNLASGHLQFMMTTSTTTAYVYADSWRIKKINVWTINYIDNATTANLYPVTVDLDSNSFNDREAAFTCSSRSEADPGHMEIIPARDTPLGAWHETSTVNSTGVLFNFVVDYGGASSGNWATVTMDIEFEYVMNVVGSAAAYTYSGTFAGPGILAGHNLFSGGTGMLLQTVNQL